MESGASYGCNFFKWCIEDGDNKKDADAILVCGAEAGAGAGPYSLGQRGQVFLKWPTSIHIAHFFRTHDLFTDITCLSFFFISQASRRLFFFGLPSRILFGRGKTSGYCVASHWCCLLVGYIIGW